MRPLAIVKSASAAVILAATAFLVSSLPVTPVTAEAQAGSRSYGVAPSSNPGKIKRYTYSRSVLGGPNVKRFRVPRDLPAIGQRKSNGVYLDTAASRPALRHHDRQTAYRNSLRGSNVQHRYIRVNGQPGDRRLNVVGRRDNFGGLDRRSGVRIGTRPYRNGFHRDYRPNGPLIISRSGNTRIDNSVNVTNEFNGNFVGGIAVVNGATGSMREIAGSSVSTSSRNTVCKYGTYCTIDLGGPKIITYNDVGDITEDDLK